jgi:signal transduction histidine kinase
VQQRGWVSLHKLQVLTTPTRATHTLLLAVGIVFATLVVVIGDIGSGSGQALAVLACLATPWALLRPAVVGLAVVMVEAVALWLGTETGLASLGGLIVVGIAQALGRRRAAVGLATALSVVHSLSIGSSGSYLPGAIETSVIFALAVGIGEVVHRLLSAERAKLDDAHRRNEEERREVARALHDTIVYATTMMVMRAEVIRGRGGHDQATLDDLDFIAGTGRHASADLRSLLRLLRQSDALPALPVAIPSLPEALAGHVQKLRLNGFEVVSHVEGQDRAADLPAPVCRALTRVLTEVSANITKHADPFTPVQLMIDIGELSAELLATNQISGVVPGRRGHRPYGLVGITEISEALAGTVQAGPVGEGGVWLTHVSLPTGRARRAPSDLRSRASTGEGT